MTKPLCIVMVGLPATGKSHMISGASTQNTWVYSTDNYIEAVAFAQNKTYNEVFHDTIGPATKAMDTSVNYAIEDGLDIIWDQTNLSVKKRKKIIRKMKDAGYDVNCICILPPASHDYQTWMQRLTSRAGKIIPMSVIVGMEESYELPELDEGFDKITYVDMYGKEVDYVQL